jgi:integrase
VPISAELHRILEEHIALGYSGERYLIRPPQEDRPLLWTALARRVRRAFTDAGLRYGMGADGLTAHSLRHTFASWLVQRDVQMLKVSQLMGDTVAEVEKSYAHLLPGDLTAAVRVLDEVLDAANAGRLSSET